ncbi:hypothetical protein PSH79_21495 [Pseudomonas sp. FP2196]|uniref:hypothetical protein n=1 Tax=Pseudomonas sp. FP2196 TaxID=2954086 RepID=UPI00273769F2|nr:hypothetical protein [Pseudomonas sp. FP2196]WLH34480.1 hypothetical protein PSH79_21495 [Pseudomonas sp. FP2196]
MSDNENTSDEKAQILELHFPTPDARLGSKVRISGRCFPREEITVAGWGVYYPIVDAQGYWSHVEELTGFPYPVLDYVLTIKRTGQTVKVRVSWRENWGTYIVFPAQGAVVEPGKPFVMKGEAITGSTVTVKDSLSGNTLGTARPGAGGEWEAIISPPSDVKELQVEASHDGFGGSPLPFKTSYVVGPSIPRITPPAAGSVHDLTFYISGSNGILNGVIQLRKEAGDSPELGQSIVSSAQGNWKVTVNVPPGNNSLVAEQVLGGIRSGRSVPVGFKVRPSPFIAVDVEIIDTSIKFSGTAHAGATVVISVPGSSITPPPSVVADLTTGIWTTTATGWPYGTGTAQIIQKVGDGASGWIESRPFTFLVENKLPDVSELAFTLDYEPTFSGIGNARATVLLWEIDREVAVASDVLLTANGPWSSKASETWGPTYKRRIRIKQTVDGQQTEWVYLDVSIPPLAPGLSDPVENGLYPRFSGTCWPGAVVNIQFSDEDDIVHKGEVVGGAWTFRREQAFDPGEHTVTVTQFAAEQTSAPVSATFPITRPMLQPIIVQPHPDGVGRNVTIFGTNGMQGATMQLRDVRFQSPLGPAKQLDAGGVWCIDLTGLEYRRYTIDALQTLNSIPSERSEQRSFDVVLLPPDIDHPTLGGKLPRTAKIVGRGMASGRVEVFLEGLAEPLLTDIAVSREGSWEAEVRLPVGHATLWARQTFRDENDRLQESENSLPLSFDVVPAAPFIETPLEGEQVGQRVVVSGFGEPGDTVTVQLNLGTQNTVVLEDRTWSVTVTSTLSSGFFPLEAKAMYDGFESDPAQRMVEQSAYRPIIDEPAAGRWLSDPVSLAGKGREGTVHVVSWFNPDVKWSPPLDVSGEAWRGESDVPLPPGGNWCRVGQTLDNDPTGVTASDWEVSARVEVVPASLKKT